MQRKESIMTEGQIKSILMGTQEYMLSKLPDSEWEHHFSASFTRNMKKLIKRDKYKCLYTIRRIAVIVLLIAGLSGGLVFAFDEEVRADVIRWITERIAENEWKYINGAVQKTETMEYNFEKILPVGYYFVDRINTENRLNEIYASEDGSLLCFTVMYSAYDGELYVVSDEKEPTECTCIGEVKADLYLSEDISESNVIVWRGENGTLFSIQGTLTKEQLIDLMKKIK